MQKVLKNIMKPYGKYFYDSTSEIYIHSNWRFETLLNSLDREIVNCARSYLAPKLWNLVRLKWKYVYKLNYWSESLLNEVKIYSHFKIKFKKCFDNATGQWVKIAKYFYDSKDRVEKKLWFILRMVNN